MRIKIGADPELFTRSRETGLFVSAHRFSRGTKARPVPVELGALQVDGTALEFNIEPAETCDDFVRNIGHVMAQMENSVHEFNVDIEASPVAEFDPDYFRRLPRRAVELGCNPDYNAYTLEPNPMPDGDRNFRTGSGHVHIGWEEDLDIENPEHFFACVSVVRQLDVYLGLATLLWDKDNRRRELYGKAGAFRPKPYGVEYRVPSNVWLRDERTQRFVFDATMKAMTDLLDGKDLGAEYGEVARELIDNNVGDWMNQGRHFDTGLDYARVA